MKISEDSANFFESVYQVAALIPYGRATSYGAIAKYLGRKGGARMVGWAMNACHTLPHVPAHRVVNASGLLTGKFHFNTNNDDNAMANLLIAEGVMVENDQIKDWKNVFWDPVCLDS